MYPRGRRWTVAPQAVSLLLLPQMTASLYLGCVSRDRPLAAENSQLSLPSTVSRTSPLDCSHPSSKPVHADRVESDAFD